MRASSHRTRGYSLVETVVVLGLTLLGLVAVVAGARTWLSAQQTDRAVTTLQAVVAAEESVYGRFASFTGDAGQLVRVLGDVSFVTTSSDTDEAVVLVGSYADVVHGTIPTVAVGVADGPDCRWVRVPDLAVRAERADGVFTGVCDVAGLQAATSVAP